MEAQELLEYVNTHYWVIATTAWAIATFFFSPIVWRMLYHWTDLETGMRTAVAIGISAVLGSVLVWYAMRPFTA